MDPDTSISSSIGSGGGLDVLYAVGRIHPRNVSRGEDGASYADSPDISRQIVLRR